jgi:hypothetical protein
VKAFLARRFGLFHRGSEQAINDLNLTFQQCNLKTGEGIIMKEAKKMENEEDMLKTKQVKEIMEE